MIAAGEKDLGGKLYKGGNAFSENLGEDLLLQRMRSQHAIAALRTDSGETLAAALELRSNKIPPVLLSPFDGSDLEAISDSDEALHYHGRGNELVAYAHRARRLRGDELPGRRRTFKWAPSRMPGLVQCQKSLSQRSRTPKAILRE